MSNEILEQLKGFFGDVADCWRENPVLTTIVIASFVVSTVLVLCMLLE